jgi:hypothetical protein
LPYRRDAQDRTLTRARRSTVPAIKSAGFRDQPRRAGHELNIITRKTRRVGAIIAVPTAVTGFFGHDVAFPGFSQPAGFLTSIALIVIGATDYVRCCDTAAGSDRSVVPIRAGARPHGCGPLCWPSGAVGRSKFGANQLRAVLRHDTHEDKPAAQSARDNTRRQPRACFGARDEVLTLPRRATPSRA